MRRELVIMLAFSLLALEAPAPAGVPDRETAVQAELSGAALDDDAGYAPDVMTSA